MGYEKVLYVSGWMGSWMGVWVGDYEGKCTGRQKEFNLHANA